MPHSIRKGTCGGYRSDCGIHLTKVLIFGSPRAGTPLMLAAPALAIDLPLKILVCESQDGPVTMAYNTAGYLADRHALPRQQSAALAVTEALSDALAEPGSAALE